MSFSFLVLKRAPCFRAMEAPPPAQKESKSGDSDLSSKELESEVKKNSRGGYRCSKCGLIKKGHMCPRERNSPFTFINHSTDPSPTMRGHTVFLPNDRATLMGRISQLESELEAVKNENSLLKAHIQHLATTTTPYARPLPTSAATKNHAFHRPAPTYGEEPYPTSTPSTNSRI